MSIYGPRKGVPVSGYRNRHQGYEPKVPPGPYSDLGLRVDAAITAAEVSAVRAYHASLKSVSGSENASERIDSGFPDVSISERKTVA